MSTDSFDMVYPTEHSGESEEIMMKPFVISIAALSGGGKTTIVSALKERLAHSAVIFWDDYGDEVDLDRDINEWSANGGDCNEWHTEPFAADIKRVLNESYEYIILDYPFGYLNDCVGKLIDMTVFIDTPLDVALARRIVRDYTSRNTEIDFGLADVEEVSLTGLAKELHFYLECSRPTYARMSETHKPISDLVVDGTKSPEEIANEIIAALWSKDAQTITTDASITARPYFEKRGYVVRKEQRVDCRGQFLPNFKMEKMKYNIIHIAGASGAGTSTLGQALEQKYGYKWFDTDDYYWQPTDPPFIKSRPREERVELLAASIEKHPRCVISGSLGVWGDVFIPRFDLVIFVDTRTDIRIERLKKREYERFGERIREGGDMYREHIGFIEWAKNYNTMEPPERCRKLHEEWFEKLSCPLLRVDGAKPIADILLEINEVQTPIH